MGEPIGGLTPDEAVEKSGSVYQELDDLVKELEDPDYDIQMLRSKEETFSNMKNDLLYEKGLEKYYGVTSESIDNAVSVAEALRKKYSGLIKMVDRRRERIDRSKGIEQKRKAAIGEAHELYQDRDNREAIQDAAVQDIGPENTSFGKSQQGEPTPDTQAE